MQRSEKKRKKSDKVFLATDPDREGEAISWHLATALKLDEKKMRRITFNEITKNAVKASLKNPRDIDMNLVDAQQARRELDRMVGYKISPVLWAKVKRGLSAGRVQSVTLRIIADREAEIDAFIPEEYWSLEAVLKVKGERRPLTAKFYGTEKEKMTIHSKKEMDEILKEIWKMQSFRLRILKRVSGSARHRYRLRPVPAAGGSKGSEFWNAEDDAYCTAIIRRCGYQGQWNRRYHYLSAYGFDTYFG